jgi:hypothetical protein
MSFDLGVWHSDEPLTDKEAGEIYLQLCEEWPYLAGECPAVAAFYQELIEHWPEIDTVPEERVGNFDFSPWSGELCHSGMAVVMSCVWTKADDVALYVKILARKHDLLLFDPQISRVILPERLRPAKRGLLQRVFRRSE